MIIRIRLSIVIGICITLVALMVLGSIALAQQNKSQEAMAGSQQTNEESATVVVPGGPGFVSLGARAFNSSVGTYDSCYTIDSEVIHLFWREDCNEGYIPTAPVQLPHGSTIKKLVAIYVDNYDNVYGPGVIVQLVRVPFGIPEGTIIAEIQSTEYDVLFHYAEDTTIEDPIVDLQMYSYYVNLSLLEDSSLSAVRIDYDYPSLLPLIQK